MAASSEPFAPVAGRSGLTTGSLRNSSEARRALTRLSGSTREGASLSWRIFRRALQGAALATALTEPFVHAAYLRLLAERAYDEL
jgi:hypothetical protein